MMEFKEIGDDQIRVVSEYRSRKPFYRSRFFAALLAVAAVIAFTLLFFLYNRNSDNASEIYPVAQPCCTKTIVHKCEELQSHTVIADTTINDVSLRVYTPHNATMSLHIGLPDKEDTDIIYAAQAADVRADNGGIVGAFVLNGEPRAWGVAKEGFCAAIDGEITIGTARSTHLFEQAIEQGGYFFRQYALVNDGTLVENEPKGKSIRKALCNKDGSFFMVESTTRESFHDFAQALVDAGIENAIYLVGGAASHGWAVNEHGETLEWGDEHQGTRTQQKNRNYIVWKKNNVYTIEQMKKLRAEAQ